MRGPQTLTSEEKGRNQKDDEIEENVETGVDVVENGLVDALAAGHSPIPVGVDRSALEHQGEEEGGLGNCDEGGKQS